jgi:hypothetical protein
MKILFFNVAINKTFGSEKSININDIRSSDDGRVLLS